MDDETCGITVVEVLSTETFPSYEVRTEVWQVGGEQYEVVSAYNRSGAYIGEKEHAEILCNKYGIAPVSIESSGDCCIGFSETKNKYYGWSHRGIYGFKIGDVVGEGDITSEYLPVGFEAKTTGDIKKMAIAYARSIS